MASKSPRHLREIPALKVPQWLTTWDEVSWDPSANRREPEHWFYLFAIPATDLKALSGIYPRSTADRKRGTDDLGIQRRHEEDRSSEIRRFIEHGFPWSDLGKAKRESGEFDEFKKPGWLPTAIVVNILRHDDQRRGKKVDRRDLVTIESSNGDGFVIQLPKEFTGSDWRPQPKSIPPIEVIDGQHRLWAFESDSVPADYYLPVVAFYGLDISWQAYLFYTINIKPKKINASLAFDLYPLLRTEDWLEKFEGHIIYRETRAQELVDLLWSHPQSPWHHRINMLGETGNKGRMVTQAAWVRTLTATYIKSWESTRIPIGGLFGAPVGSHKQTLPWSRSEQAAHLIAAGRCLEEAVGRCDDRWAKLLRDQERPSGFSQNDDLAFSGPKTLINQDQGLRAFFHVTNDLCYVRSDDLELASWGSQDTTDDGDHDEVTAALASIKKHPMGKFLKVIGDGLASFDWRTSDGPGLKEEERILRAAFRGSGGYKELRKQLLSHLAEKKGEVGKAADDVSEALGYN